MKNIQLKLYYAQTALLSLSLFVFSAFTISARSLSSEGTEGDAYVFNSHSGATDIPSVAGSSKERDLIDSGERQMNMIQAKIFSRQGLYRKSLHRYRFLLKDFPDDEGILMDYIDTLVNFSDYNLALTKVNKLIEKDPTNLEANKMKARIYNEQGKYKWTYDIYESILRQNRLEKSAWSDYASAKMNAGDWPEALNYFSQVLEHDYENRTALQNIYDIQHAHRPGLETGYRTYNQGKNNSINTHSVVYSRHVTKDTLFSLDYDHITVNRPSVPESGINPLDLTTDYSKFQLRHRFNRRLEGNIGGGYYFGFDDGFSFHTGMDYRIGETGLLRANYFLNSPWYDPLEAANRDGSFNEVEFSSDWNFLKVWGLFLGVKQLDYCIDGSREYGTKRSFTGIVTRKVKIADSIPEFYLSYSYYRSIFDYEERDLMPIAMVESEKKHTVSFNVEHWMSKRCAVILAGSVSKDLDRKLNGWSYNPGLRIKIGKRFEFFLNYNFSSESANAGGGETNAFSFMLRSKL
ncbi:MAG: hypothetical protein MRK01_12345 [Candidatus Scalindua sp.]|nr:hypothetical protein [Candidatus Scalindua sp.]